MSGYILPISKRPVPNGPAFIEEKYFLAEASVNSLKTGATYRSGLRLFADWLQHFRKDGYSKSETWPLDPFRLTMQTVIDLRNWLRDNRSKATATTYMAAVMEYLLYLEDRDRVPSGIELGKLQRRLRHFSKKKSKSGYVIDMDPARQAIPRIVGYYDSLPLPSHNDGYNRRLTILRNRAIVNLLYSTGARISEIVSLDQVTVGRGSSPTGTIIGKGNKARAIFIRPYAQEPIKAYLAERRDANPVLFVSHSRNSLNQRLTITSVHNIIKFVVKELGLDPSLSAHDFRHYRATQLLRSGMRLEVLQEYLGHADINTTRNVYAPMLGVPVMMKWLDKMDESPAAALRRLKNATQ